VDEQFWTFSRNGQPLEIRRTPTDEGFVLGVQGDGPPRSYFFAELERLEQFQADFEKFLVATGWTFVAYSPERRAGQERRHYSRLLTDRRRWWTDGVQTVAEREEEERQQVERAKDERARGTRDRRLSRPHTQRG
jgi:hypothetical protein